MRAATGALDRGIDASTLPARAVWQPRLKPDHRIGAGGCAKHVALCHAIILRSLRLASASVFFIDRTSLGVPPAITITLPLARS